MISVGQLGRFALDLERSTAGDSGAAAQEIYRYLEDIYLHPSYQRWLAEEQYDIFGPDKGRFKIPPEIGIKHLDAQRVCERHGLTSERVLLVKVDRHAGRIHLTDGFWVDPHDRVFPTTDESELVCGYAKANGLDQCDAMIDPACGSGHHSMALPAPFTISMDVNQRAIDYCGINAAIFRSNLGIVARNNIFLGLPQSLGAQLTGRVLIPVNMPFAILPRYSDEPALAQDGGDRGITYTLAALRAIAGFWEGAPKVRELRGVVLFYSLGRSSTGPWEVVEAAEKVLGSSNIKPTILTGETMWRVNGRKEQPNPMPLDRLVEKAHCRLTYPASEEAAVTAGYRSRQKQFETEGWTHLGYGILDICLKRS